MSTDFRQPGEAGSSLCTLTTSLAIPVPSSSSSNRPITVAPVPQFFLEICWGHQEICRRHKTCKLLTTYFWNFAMTRLSIFNNVGNFRDLHPRANRSQQSSLPIFRGTCARKTPNSLVSVKQCSSRLRLRYSPGHCFWQAL